MNILFDIIEQFDIYNIGFFKYNIFYNVENFIIFVVVLIFFYLLFKYNFNIFSFIALKLITELNNNLKSKFINEDFFYQIFFFLFNIFCSYVRKFN